MATSLICMCSKHISKRLLKLPRVPVLYIYPTASYKSRRFPKATPRVPPYPEFPRFPEEEYNEKADYPPIRPRYPPGKWDSGQFPEDYCWKLHEDAQEINSIPGSKDRLEKLAGSGKDYKPRPMWRATPTHNFPQTIQHHQYLTKTHVVQQLPETYNSIDVASACASIKPIVLEALVQYNEQKESEAWQPHDTSSLPFMNSLLTNSSSLKSELTHAHNLFGNILLNLLSYLCGDKEYLLRSQFDEDVRVETFWRRGGFSRELDGEEKRNILAINKYNIVQMQYNGHANYQIRTEKPLPEFLPIDDTLCLDAPYPSSHNYSPTTFGQSIIHGKPTTVSGHWIDDPCNFTLASYHLLDEKLAKFARIYGMDSENMNEKILESGMMHGFGSCVAQAHNQGFSHHWDVTYPFTTQLVLTDGKWFQFFAYQLNTLFLWKDDMNNPRKNIVWSSERMNLYETIEDGKIKGFNDNVLEHLIKIMCLAPVDRGVDLRPYLPEEEDPSLQKLYINHKGEVPIEHPPIGQFRYPVDAVYN